MILCIYMNPMRKSDERNLKAIISSIKHFFDAKIIERSNLSNVDVNRYDIVMTIGGDGTFLKTATHIRGKTKIFGINMNPSYKEGFYTRANSTNIKERLDRIKKGEYKIRRLKRLKAKINDKEIRYYALNEVFFGNMKSHLSAVYYLRYKGKVVRHKSSGVIISTPTGANGWYRSAGGKILRGNKYRYVVREPYCGKIVKCKMIDNTFDRSLYLISEMEEGILAIDSNENYRVRKGDRIKVMGANNDINFIDI